MKSFLAILFLGIFVALGTGKNSKNSEYFILNIPRQWNISTATENSKQEKQPSQKEQSASDKSRDKRGFGGGGGGSYSNNIGGYGNTGGAAAIAQQAANQAKAGKLF